MHYRRLVMKIEVYRSGVIRKSWKWRMKSKNGRILASGKGFDTKQNCKKSLYLVAQGFTE